MFATLRWYGGNTELADHLAARADELQDIMGEVPGLEAYYLIKTDGGTVSVTITEDEAGGEASSAAAAAWLRDNMPENAPDPPQVSSGEVVASI
jgi:hypothetical protein